MRVLLFGATGMIGQAVLRECLADGAVTEVVSIGRRPSGQKHQKLREVVVADLAAVPDGTEEASLGGFDACFLCVGVTAVGLTEAEYTAITYDLTLAVARGVVRRNPAIALIYVSGQGADASERGRSMWARVKGRTENALLALPVRAFMFRPGLIIPLHGIRSRTAWYNAVYAVLRPLNRVLLRFLPGSVTTTERLGRAMLAVVRRAPGPRIIETRDINALAQTAGVRDASGRRDPGEIRGDVTP